MRFRRKRARAVLETLDEAAKMRHALRLRWLDEAERTQSPATTQEPEPQDATSPWMQQVEGVWDPDYRSRRPFATNRPSLPNPDLVDFISDAGWKRMAKAIINLTPDPSHTPQERTAMSDEIKVGDTVRPADTTLDHRAEAAVLAIHGEWLWLTMPGCRAFTRERRHWRKVNTPTPCPEGWANVYPEDIGPWHSTRADADFDRRPAPHRIGVLHLSPNGDTEFIRTEEL